MRKEKRKQGNVKRIKREQKRKRQVRSKLYAKKGGVLRQTGCVMRKYQVPVPVLRG